MLKNKSKAWYINHRDINGFIERCCTICNEWLPETEEYFYLHNKSKPEKGFNAECKKCAIKRTKERTEKNHDEVLSYILDYQKGKGREKSLKRWSEYGKQNREHKNNNLREWASRNPEKIKEYNENRQHKNHNITKTEWEACKEYFNYECAYCGLPIEEHYRTYAGELQKIDLHKEHVDHEGLNDLSNCIPSCGECNSEKWEKTLDGWYNENNLKFTQERYNKIIKWLEEDYKKYLSISSLSISC